MSVRRIAELEGFVIDQVQPTGNMLGTGAYGSVEEVDISGLKVAAKKLHSELINLDTNYEMLKWVTDFVEECKLMSQLRHPNIVQFLGVCYLRGSKLPVLLMEKLTKSLDSLLENTPNIPTEVKVHLLTGTARGIVYLHSRRPAIAHRDLTARNILVDNGLNAKIADMGVAKMVNIQPDQLAATMTEAPGNNLYMPPEAVPDEGRTRYSLSIDMFSFGVVSLFTLTQTFPRILKPATYRDPRTHTLVARTEINRREEYVLCMKRAIGEAHPLVRLTLMCLEFDQGMRPTAMEALRCLEEVSKSIPKLNVTKLELFRYLATRDGGFIQRLSQQIDDCHAQILKLQTELTESKETLDLVLSENGKYQKKLDQLQSSYDELKSKDHEGQARGLQELITLQQEQLEIQKEEIDHLSSQLKALSINPQPALPPAQSNTPSKNTAFSQHVRQRPRQSFLSSMFETSPAPTRSHPSTQHVPPPQLMSFQIPPSSNDTPLRLHWRRRRPDMPQGLHLLCPPVTCGHKLYAYCIHSVGNGIDRKVVFEYTPSHEHWSNLPTPQLSEFTLATLKGKLVALGEKRRAFGLARSTIIVTLTDSGNWKLPDYPAMPPTQVFSEATSAVIGYKEHLIVAGGVTQRGRLAEVSIFNAANKEWISASRLPTPDHYRAAIINDTIYLIGQSTRKFLRAHLPTLLFSSPANAAWETLKNAPSFHLVPLAADNNLLVMGGRVLEERGPTTGIQCYNSDVNEWTGVGELPEPFSHGCHYAEHCGQIFVFGGQFSVLQPSNSVYFSTYSFTL